MLLAAKLARWGDRLLTLAAALLLGALALFGAWSLWDIAATRRAALPEQTLRFKPLAAAPADSPGFAELRALNPDVCGWLTLDGTRIDFPVVQGADNMVYVNTDVYGDFSLSGAIFLDSRCPADFTAPYSIVYGHHIEDGGMFGDIVQFTQNDYFAAHTTGTLITDDTSYNIALFACVRADVIDSYNGIDIPEGDKLVQFHISVTNTSDSGFLIFKDDFQLQWGDGDSDFGVGFDAVDDDMLAEVTGVSPGSTLEGNILVAVPQDTTTLTVAYQETYEDGSDANAYFVDLSL